MRRTGVRNTGGWLRTVCSEDRDAIHTIMAQYNRKGNKQSEGWSVLLTPSTGPAKTVTLRKDESGALIREWIIR